MGQLFRVTTFGESHGLALGCIIDGFPLGMELSEKDLKIDLDRRCPGNFYSITQQNEFDHVTILSSVFNGITTGVSIGLLVKNKDQQSQDYINNKDIFRSGHADYTYQKYGLRDYLGGGRYSARETVMRVACWCNRKKYLQQKLGIIIRGYLSQMGDIYCELKRLGFS